MAYVCKKCGKKYDYIISNDNYPGGKCKEDIICPWCDSIEGQTMTSGFVYSQKIEESDDNK